MSDSNEPVGTAERITEVIEGNEYGNYTVVLSSGERREVAGHLPAPVVGQFFITDGDFKGGLADAYTGEVTVPAGGDGPINVGTSGNDALAGGLSTEGEADSTEGGEDPAESLAGGEEEGEEEGEKVTLTVIPTADELKAKPVAELKTIAKELEIKLPRNAKEDEIIDLILKHYAAAQPAEEATISGGEANL